MSARIALFFIEFSLFCTFLEILHLQYVFWRAFPGESNLEKPTVLIGCWHCKLCSHWPIEEFANKYFATFCHSLEFWNDILEGSKSRLEDLKSGFVCRIGTFSTISSQETTYVFPVLPHSTNSIQRNSSESRKSLVSAAVTPYTALSLFVLFIHARSTWSAYLCKRFWKILCTKRSLSFLFVSGAHH